MKPAQELLCIVLICAVITIFGMVAALVLDPGLKN